MKRLAILATAIALASGPAFAQMVIDLTPEQETTVYSTLHTTGTVGAAPSNETFTVGQPLPESVELSSMPATVEIETIKDYRYAVIGEQVVLVEPGNRKIVKVIEKK